MGTFRPLDRPSNTLGGHSQVKRKDRICDPFSYSFQSALSSSQSENVIMGFLSHL